MVDALAPSFATCPSRRLELEPEPATGPLPAPSEELVKSVKRVIKSTVLSIVVTLSEKKIK